MALSIQPGGLWCLLLALTLGHGVYLWLDERRYRQALAPLPALKNAAAPSPPLLAAPDPGALLIVLGFEAQEAPRPSTDSAVLSGIFAASTGESRALLAVAGSQRSYGVGERLPSGSVLRRIEADRVLLWRNGREEVLSLAGPAAPIARAAGLPAQSTHLHLRPTVAKGKR